MSNALAISAVTAVIQEILTSALALAPLDEGVDGAEVLTVYPGSDAVVSAGKPRVNVYLYQVVPNAAFRNADLPVRPGSVALDLHYLLSFYGGEDALEPQRLLGLAARALSARGIVGRDGIKNALQSAIKNDSKKFLAKADLAKAPELIKITPLALSLEEMSKLWSVFFQAKYALSIAYQCSVVVIDSEKPETRGPPVLERHVEVVQLKRPVIERVIASEGEGKPILPGAEVTVLGRDLEGQSTIVIAGGVEVTSLIEVTPSRLRFLLPSSLATGIQGLVVLHRFLLGKPPVPHTGVDSDVAAFRVGPTVPVFP